MATKAVMVPLSGPLDSAPLLKALRRLWRLLRMRMVRASAAPERMLAVEERISVGPKKALLVVRCHGQRFLVGMSADAVGPFVEVGAAAGSAADAVAKPGKRSARRRSLRAGSAS